MTLLPLPISHITKPSEWTTTLHGNITITILLFLTRSAYLLGIGRGSGPVVGGAQGQRRKSHGQAGVPLPPARDPALGSGVEVVKKVEEVERSPIKRRGKQA